MNDKIPRKNSKEEPDSTETVPVDEDQDLPTDTNSNSKEEQDSTETVPVDEDQDLPTDTNSNEPDFTEKYMELLDKLSTEQVMTKEDNDALNEPLNIPDSNVAVTDVS